MPKWARAMAIAAQGGETRGLTPGLSDAPVRTEHGALPLLLLLPAAALAWPGPGAFLVNDPFPHLTGTGVIALASLPAAAWLAVVCGETRAPPLWRAATVHFFPDGTVKELAPC